MGARLQIELTTEQERTLYELSLATTVPQRVQERALMVRLSHQGLYVEEIAKFMHRNVRTVRESLNRWKHNGMGGLWDAPHPGAQKRWHEQDLDYLESCLRNENQTYNSRQLADKLKKERHVTLTPGHLRE
ncbi:MAG: helix-turn-helix domain-containing protein, partial [Cyanobacteria bacterium P01_F01_bin.3]